ncbi:hypothetical protein [Povalibacter sp.]|uniref:hypothetical protein n=1 Tax=Povalibacter sp. TaxID=1962978 RepID=UPI002F42830E
MEQVAAAVIPFIGWGLYPAWLVAGGCDYLCHRATDIGYTSGPTESWLHVAQFATLLALLCFAIFVTPSWLGAGLLVVCVIAHSALSLIDVSYTVTRRHVSVFEQFVHGFMDVIPCVAVALLIAVQWPLRAAPEWRTSIDPGSWLLLGSFIVLSGLPIFEELIRTYRQAAGSSQRAATLMGNEPAGHG